MKRKAAMRYLYLYDPDERRFVEFRNITNCSVYERELLRLGMITTARFPLLVLDSSEDGFPDPAPFGVYLASHRRIYASHAI